MTRNRRNGEPLLSLFGSWAVLGASFALSADTWIALAEIAGFTRTIVFPDFTFAMAWLMPICVDGYVVVALTLWMSPVPARVANFAKYNTYIAAGIGIAAQSLYHLLMTMSNATEEWQIWLAALVGAFPPALAGLAIHMRALIRRESHNTNTNQPAAPKPSRVAGLISTIGQIRQAINETTTTTPTTSPAPTDLPAPTTVPAPATVPAPTKVPVPATLIPARPAPMPAEAEMVSIPTPAQVADRITPKQQPPHRSADAMPESLVPSAIPSPTSPPKVSATPLTPSSIGPQAVAKDAVQLVLPLANPAVLARATQIAAEYQAQYGTRITAGQLQVRMRDTRLTREQATTLLAQIDDTPDTPQTVNGRPVNA
ncbi:hypothetical protein Rhe02_14530 [Rhizocola hellebori]|uniref:DUF2637 domain-containing protein n=1 Tax=Rhizocola hellebori TaxID=1392758 RepID=A0A8J3VEK0_9ACTN|nr:hypothetical protein [Rhizocola hellebori]GIH03386.1 hypothetical protein Rhe02_14530 [Rhizocola hellebori]